MVRVRKRASNIGPPGIVQIAQKAGVSTATVSRALNKPDVVRPATLQKVKQAASALGYIKNSLAGTLHQRRSGTIGLVVPTVDNAIFAEFINAFSKTLNAEDLNLVLATHDYNLTTEVDIVRALLEKRVDGIVLIGNDHDPRTINMLESRAHPTVFAWNYVHDAQFPSAGCDNHLVGRIAAQHLKGLGHINPVLVFPKNKNNDRARQRLRGAMSVYPNLDPSSFITAPYDIGLAKQCVGEFLDKILKSSVQSNRPTALLCGNDIIAQGALLACQARKVSVPEYLSIMGIGDFRSSAFLEPSLSTVRVPATEIGAKAASLIVRICKDSDSSTVQGLRKQISEEIAPALRARRSTAIAI